MKVNNDVHSQIFLVHVIEGLAAQRLDSCPFLSVTITDRDASRPREGGIGAFFSTLAPFSNTSAPNILPTPAFVKYHCVGM